MRYCIGLYNLEKMEETIIGTQNGVNSNEEQDGEGNVEIQCGREGIPIN